MAKSRSARGSRQVSRSNDEMQNVSNRGSRKEGRISGRSGDNSTGKTGNERNANRGRGNERSRNNSDEE